MDGASVPRVQAYMRIARAPFLALPITLILLGSATAVQAAGFDPVAAALALFGLVALHISVNARNEYRDYESGVDAETERTPFSGGSGALPEGALEPAAARRLAAVTAAAGAIVGGYFVVTVGVLLVPIAVLGAVSVLFYTSHLTRYGLGELFAGLGLGGLPVLGTGFVQVGSITPAMVAASVPSTFLTLNLLLLNEFPDVEADRKGDRLNLIHRLGRPAAARIYVTAGLAVPASIVLGWLVGPFSRWALIGVLPSVLLARPAGWAIGQPESALPLPAQRDNVLWILATNVALAGGLILPAVL